MDFRLKSRGWKPVVVSQNTPIPCGLWLPKISSLIPLRLRFPDPAGAVYTVLPSLSSCKYLMLLLSSIWVSSQLCSRYVQMLGDGRSIAINAYRVVSTKGVWYDKRWCGQVGLHVWYDYNHSIRHRELKWQVLDSS